MTESTVFFSGTKGESILRRTAPISYGAFRYEKKSRMVPFWAAAWWRSFVAGFPSTASQVSWKPARTLTTRPVSDQRARHSGPACRAEALGRAMVLPLERGEGAHRRRRGAASGVRPRAERITQRSEGSRVLSVEKRAKEEPS